MTEASPNTNIEQAAPGTKFILKPREGSPAYAQFEKKLGELYVVSMYGPDGSLMRADIGFTPEQWDVELAPYVVAVETPADAAG